MLRTVISGRAQYRGDHAGLVMLGVRIRDVIDAGLTWCVSDGNAASPVVRFRRDLDGIGSFIDFHLMTQFMWSNTPDDLNRQTRRAAELLILGRLPVTLITHVVVSTPRGDDMARQTMRTVGGTRHYEVQPCFLYQ
jgi:hypothetical protein